MSLLFQNMPCLGLSKTGLLLKIEQIFVELWHFRNATFVFFDIFTNYLIYILLKKCQKKRKLHFQNAITQTIFARFSKGDLFWKSLDMAQSKITVTCPYIYIFISIVQHVFVVRRFERVQSFLARQNHRNSVQNL